MNFNQLTLILTDCCNAKCDICVFDCSPNKNLKMSLTDAFDYIKQASTITEITTIGISGGEVFLYYKDLIKVIKKASSYNFKVIVTTNGFWGEDEFRAKLIIKELINSGLSKLEISTDEFHSKYIPYASIKNILRIGNELGLSISISTVVTKKSLRLKEIVKALDEDILGFSITERPCVPVGRALRQINNEDFITQKAIPFQRCLKQTNLVIFPNGKTYPCCSLTTFNDILSLGSAKELTIEQIIKKFNCNIYCKLLQKYGSKWFVDIIKKHKLPIPLRKNYVGLCDLCGDLFKDKKYINYYKPFIDKEKFRLYSTKYKNISND